MKRTHGRSSSGAGGAQAPIYRVWANMKQRCYNENNTAYERYGGAGITVCKRWHSFDNFYADVGDPPTGMTLDRVNNKKGYSPSNCRWASYTAQARNSTRAVLVSIEGVTRCLTAWCEVTGISYGLFKARRAAGWPLEEALTRAPRKTRRNKIVKKNVDTSSTAHSRALPANPRRVR